MSCESERINAHERDRWLRHDAHRFIRHDVKRFLKPGVDPADVFPALARRREAEEAAFAAQIARSYRLLATPRAEVAPIKADMVRRRLAEQTKYSPTQPRVPGGNRDGGQWTDRSGGGGTVGGLSQDAGQSQDVDQSRDVDLASPMGNVDIGDVSGSSELGDLFRIKPDETHVDGVQLAGDPVDLLEQRGGHAIGEHAGMTYDYLKSRARDEGRRTLERGDYLMVSASDHSHRFNRQTVWSTRRFRTTRIRSIREYRMANLRLLSAKGFPLRPATKRIWRGRTANRIFAILLASALSFCVIQNRLEAGVSNPPIPYGDTMDDHEELSFTIDHNGVHFRAPVRGKKRFLLERAFLDDLVGEFAPRNKTRPVPDPSTDFYMLSDQQLDAYSAFRHRMERELR